MSELPDRPSLDHLRKQAKALLKALRRQNPRASLSEAQHTLARDYGFANWPKLKAHAERLAAHPEPPIFPRFTPKARESLFFAWHEANRLRSGIIEPGHVLLALMRVTAGLETPLFTSTDLDNARALIGARSTATVPVPPDRHIALGDRAHRVLRAAVEEADARHHERVGLAHLLLGVLREADPGTAGVIGQLGIGPPEGGPHDGPIWQS